MSLSIETAVRGVADALRDKIAPALEDSFTTEVSRLSVILLTIMANAADDAVPLRVEENAALRAILSDGAPLVDDGGLAGQLTQAAASADPGLRISELDGETDRLRRLLIALQERLESSVDPAAKAMDQRIWRLLRDSEEKRTPRV
ncbi:MAG TPA: hypothetical protein VF463_03575 [Sphingobium sp.]